LIDLLDELGKAHGASVAQMALAWLMQRPAITAPIIGANNVKQLKDILGSLEVKLTAEDVLKLDKASAWQEKD
jgi:aryl-alcohol dehydrogenase-like predicted oxidoreductase